MVRAAVAEISAASGIEMIEDGVTSIDVSDPNQALPSLAEGEVVIGFAPPGSPAIQRCRRARRRHCLGTASDMVETDPTSPQGSVALNREAAVTLPLDFSSGASLGAVLLHEIGHVVGLQHVGPSTQIMAPAANPNSPGHLGTGDLAGLATLKNRPCEN